MDREADTVFSPQKTKKELEQVLSSGQGIERCEEPESKAVHIMKRLDMRTFTERPKITQQITSTKSRIHRQAHRGQSAAVSSILQTQRLNDNNDEQRSIEVNSLRGLKAEVREEEILRGRTTDEIIEDIVRPVGTALGNVVTSTAGLLTGISVSTKTTQGPTWKNHGAFVWHVGFNTTGRSGWIVQDLVNTWRAKDARGNAVASPLTPHFLEAWAVDGAGKVTPAIGADNDYWDNPNLQTSYGAVEGHLSTRGKVYFTKTNPATQGFTKNNPATNAVGLLSSTTTPAGLGMVRLFRYAQSTWDSTKPVPTHFGSAGP